MKDPYNRMFSRETGAPPVRFVAVVLLLLAGCALRHGGTPIEQPLSLEERAQALDDVIRTRYIGISDSPPVDLCSVFFALDRNPRFQEWLGEYARSRLSAGSVESCPASAREQRQENGWYVREFVRSGPGELWVVTARNGHGGHRETYVMHHGYGDQERWRVREVRISDFWYE